MKKKLIFCAAAFAAIATVTSCSSDEPLLEAQQVLETEEPVVDPNDTGIPFTINATVDGDNTTRATDVTKNSGDNPLVYFQLYAVNGTNNWINGTTFNKDGNWTGSWGDSGQPNWPTGTSTFYGISNNTATAPTFTGTITSGSFTYELPGDVTDGQEDLLVATATGDATSGVSLSFKHALAAVTGLSFKLNTLLTGTNDAEGYYLLNVKEISFCNLITKGTFTYDATKANGVGNWDTEALADNSAWEAVEDKEEVKATLTHATLKYLVPNDCPESVTIDEDNYPSDDYTVIWPVTLTDNIYLLPQSNISPWEPGTPNGTVYPNSPLTDGEVGAYIRIKCVFAWTDEIEDYDSQEETTWLMPLVGDNAPGDLSEFNEDAGADIYVPFSATSISFNKGYKLNINLLKSFIIDGSNRLVPIIQTASMDA
ncbi:MAG: hypothetical protein IJ551_04080 [Prevotella sp.]|nr:hypothetical protein [Prevotella sp.]